MDENDIIFMKEVIDTLCDMNIPRQYIISTRQVVDHFYVLHKKPADYRQVWIALMILSITGAYQDLKKGKDVHVRESGIPSDFYISW